MVRIAVLGAGNHSSGTHGPALRTYAAEHPGEIELAAVCDLDSAKAQKYADTFGFATTYTQVEAMLAEQQPDGLIAVTPIVLTEKIVSELLPQGIPMSIEKPPGEDSAATRRLLSVAEACGTPHMVSLNRRFSPALMKAREWLAEAGAGRPPRVALGRMLRHNRREQDFVVGTAIHLLDAVISVLGRPTHVAAANLTTATPESYLTQACLSFGNDTRAHFIISPTVGTLEETCEIHGDDYCIQLDLGNCTINIWDGKEQVVSWHAPAEAGSEYLNGTLGETAAFIHAIETDGGFRPDLQAALVSMLACEAVAAGGESDIVI